MRNEVFMSAGWNAEAMESNAYHKAEDWNDDDMEVHIDSFMVELRVDVFQDVKAMKEHKVDIEVLTIIGTEAKIMKQVSSWGPAGIKWVRLENTGATTESMRNTSDELSWDGAKARSLAGGFAIYLVLDIEELIERIGHERVAENLTNAVMNSTNSEVNSEEPECVWTVLCQACEESLHELDWSR